MSISVSNEWPQSSLRTLVDRIGWIDGEEDGVVRGGSENTSVKTGVKITGPIQN